jgi:glyoxylate/hydroxypyruvate reductase A
MAILVAANFDEREWAQWRPALEHALPGERLVFERAGVDARDIDIAIVANPPAGSLQGLPGLRLVQSLWAGVERLLADPTVPSEVPLARMVDPAMNEAMAETALWAVISLHRGFFDYAAQQRDACWAQHAQRRADEMSVAVLGLGEMGRAVARRLARNGYRVLGWSRSPAQVEGVQCHAGEAGLSQALRATGIVVNLLPLTPDTRGLFDARVFARMQRGAALVNLARGAHVVEADLLDALDSGQLGHAVLDVFCEEPLPAGHRFWRHPGVTVLPHVAAQTDPRTAAELAAANVRALRAGQPLAHLVDRLRGY